MTIPALSEKSFNRLLTLLFFLLASLVMLHHEMWRDELHSWLIVKKSASLNELFNNKEYEGHPALWYLLLFVIQKLWAAPAAMQAVHLVAATAVVFTFLQSPFSRVIKVLFAFSYFPLYEYGVLSRNYAIGLLLLFAFCILFSKASRNYIFMAVILFLACQANLFSLIISFCLWMFVAADLLMNNREIANKKTIMLFASASGIVVAGIVVSIAEMAPPADHDIHTGWDFRPWAAKVFKAISVIYKSYIPIPDFDFRFWNTTLLDSSYLQSLVSVALFTACFLLLLETPIVAFIYATGTLGMTLFFYSNYYGFLRHHGHLFMLFIICCWLSGTVKPATFKKHRINKFLTGVKKQQSLFLTAILAIHVLAAGIAVYFDYKYVFSPTELTARYLREQKLDTLFIAGYRDHIAAPLSGYLGRDIYHIEAKEMRSFVIWKKNPSAGTLEEFLNDMKSRRQKAVVVLSQEAEAHLPLIKLAEFKHTIIKDEVNYIYLTAF